MPLPFKALSPIEPRVVDLPYSAMLPACVDVSDQDVTDSTDSTDLSDSTEGGGGDVII